MLQEVSFCLSNCSTTCNQRSYIFVPFTWMFEFRVLSRGCTPTIVHRDLNISYILLDNNMGGKIVDFGLSKPMVGDPQVSTRPRGNSVIWIHKWPGQLSEKSDIYRFGVILLELITGR